MKLSTTYTTAIGSIVGLIVTVAGLIGFELPFTSEELTITIGVIVDLAFSLWVVVHRHSKGDINALGVK